ncbi:MAG: hypothetical protein HYZ53_15595 [Planctomycetes bacterium]|nr:hypothetical protein [Planctomycetota bacterium]
MNASTPAGLGVVQFNPRRGEPERNLRALAHLASQALAAGVRLLVLPEMASTGYRFPGRLALRPFAEPPSGPTFRTFAPLAARYRALLVVGFVEADGARLFNSAHVLGPSGEAVALYRKRLLYVDDTTWADLGDLPYPLFATPFGRATVGICMDINGDEFVEHVHRVRPDLVCFPTNWVDSGTDVHAYWAERLAGWDGVLVAADRWGEEDGVRFAGRSACLRRGVPLVQAPAEGDGWWSVG